MKMILSFLPLCLLSIPCFCGSVKADESSPAASPKVNPAINAYYLNADLERWIRIFENPTREVYRERFRIIQAARPQPGMRVADVGAGTGFFTMLFARAVGPSGRVYAVDISENFLREIRRRAAVEHNVDNVETLLNDQHGIGLAEGSLDLVFISDTYHHFENPQSMLASISAALRDDGELILVDFRRIQGLSSPWVMRHVRANKDEVVEELSNAGFVLVEEEDFMRENYFLRFRKGSG